MIVTLTANPSVDRTASLPGPLERGGVLRLSDLSDVAGGKGINVARVLAGARSMDASAVRAVFPAPPRDPFVDMVSASGLVHDVVPVAEPVRVNLTLTEPDGTTTKLNAPGAPLPAETRAALVERLVAAAGRNAGGWVALCGSLPTGTDPAFYLSVVETLHDAGLRVALDTSDAPLEALGAALRSRPSGVPGYAPDLLKPNGLELGQLLGLDGQALERDAEAGDLSPVVDAAERLVGLGVGAVLVTLGGAGAALATEDGVWSASAPPVEVRSTVGAGDSSLAGYLLAEHAGLAPGDRLRWAIAHGSAAAALPGTGVPEGLDTDGPAVAAIDVTRHRPPPGGPPPSAFGDGRPTGSEVGAGTDPRSDPGSRHDTHPHGRRNDR